MKVANIISHKIKTDSRVYKHSTRADVVAATATETAVEVTMKSVQQPQQG